MKKIPLKTLPGDNGLPDIEYRDVLREVVKRPQDPQKGADIQEMRMSIRVLDVLDKASDGSVSLEDSDFDYLKNKLMTMQWNMIDRRIVQLVDDVCGA